MANDGFLKRTHWHVFRNKNATHNFGEIYKQ